MSFQYQSVTNNVFKKEEVETIIDLIHRNRANQGFGVRNFLSNNVEILQLIQESDAFIGLVKTHFDRPSIIKSIYFDKPSRSNWAVNWHQDITVNFTDKLDLVGYSNWRVLKDRVVVQPEKKVLNSILTYRIHLDHTDESNGALKIISGSENEGVNRLNQDYINDAFDRIEVCNVELGGVMRMSPLTVHASQRSKDNKKRRRVIHLEVIEATDEYKALPWKEKYVLA